MEQKVLNIAKLLPDYEDLCQLAVNERESNYSFRLASDVLSNIVKDFNVTSEIGQVIDYEEEFFLIESLTDKMWEKINTGHFSQVPMDIRKIYAAANCFKIIFLLLSSQDKSNLEKCSEILDKAMLVGCTENLYKGIDKFITHLTSFLDDLIGTEKFEFDLIKPLEYKSIRSDIPILDCPSMDSFKEFFDSRRPVILKNTINHWPALNKWRDLNYIIQIAGNRTVPVEIGSNYATAEWSQELVKLKDFLRRQFSNSTEFRKGQEHFHVEYLAQHELFDQIPQLKDDIRIPDYCCLGEDSIEPSTVDIKAWLGPSGTVSPLHQDPKHNILCQVFGYKKIILASCDDSDFVYPHENTMLSNTSQLDAEKIDFNKFPLASKATFYHLTLQEGECLYIPPKWWHYVKSLSKSFSVSFWWE